MSQWIQDWSRGWRGEHLEVPSPLSVADARRRLREGVVPRRRLLTAQFSLSAEQRVMVGHVDDDFDEVRLEVTRPRMRNSWRPVFRGELVPTGQGSALVGELGWDPLVKVFTVVWFGFVGLFFLIAMVATVARLNTGDAADAGLSLKMAGVPVLFMLFFVGVTTFGQRLAREDERYLRTWLAERLRSAPRPEPTVR